MFARDNAALDNVASRIGRRQHDDNLDLRIGQQRVERCNGGDAEGLGNLPAALRIARIDAPHGGAVTKLRQGA